MRLIAWVTFEMRDLDRLKAIQTVAIGAVAPAREDGSRHDGPCDPQEVSLLHKAQ